MPDLAREHGRTERYLPRSAWAQMSPAERRETDEKRKKKRLVINPSIPTFLIQKKLVRLVGELLIY